MANLDRAVRAARSSWRQRTLSASGTGRRKGVPDGLADGLRSQRRVAQQRLGNRPDAGAVPLRRASYPAYGGPVPAIRCRQKVIGRQDASPQVTKRAGWRP